jgi:hypothetical protein
MRSNSGKDESRDNLQDPTMRDPTQQRKDPHRSHKSHGTVPADDRASRTD